MKNKFLIIALLLLSGCSSCRFVFDIGPGKGYCYAAEAQEKYCRDHGGKHISYSISPLRFNCADGTEFEAYGDGGYPKKWRVK